MGLLYSFKNNSAAFKFLFSMLYIVQYSLVRESFHFLFFSLLSLFVSFLHTTHETFMIHTVWPIVESPESNRITLTSRYRFQCVSPRERHHNAYSRVQLGGGHYTVGRTRFRVEGGGFGGGSRVLPKALRSAE